MFNINLLKCLNKIYDILFISKIYNKKDMKNKNRNI